MVEDLKHEDDQDLYKALHQVDIAFVAILKARNEFSVDGTKSEAFKVLTDAALLVQKATSILEGHLSLYETLRLDLVEKN